MAAWDPSQYLKFAGPRARPALDLLNRVELDSPGAVFDLGCGAGNVTRMLARRWPEATVTGVDGSAEMLARAERFFDCYNAALSDYRRALGIRGTHRPVPDLLRRESRFEFPVWVQQADDPRSRLFVERRRGALHLFADRRSIGVIDSDLHVSEPGAVYEYYLDERYRQTGPKFLGLSPTDLPHWELQGRMIPPWAQSDDVIGPQAHMHARNDEVYAPIRERGYDAASALMAMDTDRKSVV